MPVRSYLPVLLLGMMLGLPRLALSQATAQAPSGAPVKSIAPYLSNVLHGANASLTLTSLHDSVTGWATLATPALGYRIDDHFSVDVSIPVYFYRLAESLSRKPRPDSRLVARRSEPGDLIVGLHADFSPRLADYQLTGLIAVPTGDKLYGLTTGRVTFDVTNDFQHTFRHVTPNVELGIGDSSALINRRVTKNYTSLGPLAHFQVGIGINLPRNAFFESDVYEQLPIGDQKIYGPTRDGKATIVIGHNISEDNGFTNLIDFPLNRRTTFSDYYNRSLHFNTDTVAIGFTFNLRAAPQIDLADPNFDDLFR
ncbi:MAG: hypothetical protein ABI197_13475 [Granulicella sp.]